MKRQQLIRELEAAGCVFVRHGGRHDVCRNPRTAGERRGLAIGKFRRRSAI